MTLNEFINGFSLGLHRNSRLILDNVGIETRGYSLPSSKLVHFTRGQYEGLGVFGHWWMKHIYPCLYPQRYQARKACHIDAMRIHNDAKTVYYLEQALSIAKGLAHK